MAFDFYTRKKSYQRVALTFLVLIFFSMPGWVFSTTTTTSLQSSDIRQDESGTGEAEFIQRNPDGLFTVYSVTNDSVNRLITILTFIVAIFGVFIAGFAIFFAVKQISADREIKEYRDSIKENKAVIEKEVKKMLKDIAERSERIKGIEEKASRNAQEIDKKLKKLKPISSRKDKNYKELKKARSDLEDLKGEIEKLKEEQAFQKGQISTSVEAIDVTRSLYPGLTTYSTSSGGTISLSSLSSPSLLSSSSFCSKCGHTNEIGSKFCSNCGGRL